MTQGATKFFMAVRARELGQGKAKGAREIQMLYRVSGEMKLLRATDLRGHGTGRGEFLGMDSIASGFSGDVGQLLRQVAQVISQEGFGGVACFFPGARNPDLMRFVQGLEDLCQQEKIPLLLPETYGEKLVYGKVFVSSMLSGGSLEGKCLEAVAKYGRERVVLDIQPMGEDYLLPAPGGSGIALGAAVIGDLQQEKGAEVFYSRELCARYFTYENGENSLHFVLFDDEGSIGEKIRLAGLWGMWGVAVACEDVGRKVLG